MPKKLIIRESQLFEIMDSSKTQITFTGQNANEMGTNALSQYNDATRAGLKPDSIQMVGKTPTNNATEKDEVQVGIDTNTPNLKDAVTKSVQNAVNNGADINKLVVHGNAEDVNNSVYESVKLSKKDVIRHKLSEMKKNGTALTKKQLTEEVENDQKIISVINSMMIFDVLDIFKEVYGDEKLQSLSYFGDYTDGIIKVMNRSDEESKNRFIQLILEKANG